MTDVVLGEISPAALRLGWDGLPEPRLDSRPEATQRYVDGAATRESLTR